MMRVRNAELFHPAASSDNLQQLKLHSAKRVADLDVAEVLAEGGVHAGKVGQLQQLARRRALGRVHLEARLCT